MKKRLFWRVYAYGLLLLIAIALGMGLVSRIVGSKYTDAPQRAAAYLKDEVSPLLDKPEALQAKLEQLHRIFETDLAVYDANGKELARAGDPPGALDEAPRAAEMKRRGSRQVFALPLREGAYLTGSAAFAGSSFWLYLAVVLAVLALASVPLVRSIVRPVEKLTVAARSLGAGDLSVRSGICRRDEVGALAKAFDDMAARLEAMVESERELLANVSHELRTPLARVRVALELAEGDSDPKAYRERLTGIGGDLTELETLIEDVLAAARLDLASGREGDLSSKKTRIDVRSVCEDATRAFETQHPARTVALSCESAIIVADAGLLRRALTNLLENAAKYSDPGTEITVRAHGGEPTAIEVSDRGIGVEEKDLPRMFDPFFRTDRSRERSTGGVGLGLALCRRIAQAHDGTIGAELRPGGGLTVRIELPAPSVRDTS